MTLVNYYEAVVMFGRDREKNSLHCDTTLLAGWMRLDALMCRGPNIQQPIQQRTQQQQTDIEGRRQKNEN